MSDQQPEPKEERGGSRPGLSPEDGYANVNNPNNLAHAADQENQRKQREQASGGS